MNGQLTIEHLALRTQPITLRHQIINLLASLQHTLDSLMQHDLRLIKLLLNLHNTICLRRVLVLYDVILELGEGEGRRGVSPGGTWVLCEELVDDFGQKLVGYERRVGVV